MREEPLPVMGDRAALVRLVRILADNVLKYTSAPGRFSVDLEAIRRFVPGAGLGLSIARWIVDRHGGSIAVESEPGKGFRVQVALPRVEA